MSAFRLSYSSRLHALPHQKTTVTRRDGCLTRQVTGGARDRIVPFDSKPHSGNRVSGCRRMNVARRALAQFLGRSPIEREPHAHARVQRQQLIAPEAFEEPLVAGEHHGQEQMRLQPGAVAQHPHHSGSARRSGPAAAPAGAVSLAVR